MLSFTKKTNSNINSNDDDEEEEEDEEDLYISTDVAIECCLSTKWTR